MISFAEVFVAGFCFFVIYIFSAVYTLLTIGTISVETRYGHRGGSKGNSFGYLCASFVRYVWDDVSIVSIGGTERSGTYGARIVSVAHISREDSVVALSRSGSANGTERYGLTIICLYLSTVVYHSVSEDAGVLDNTYRGEKISSASTDRSTVGEGIGKLHGITSGTFYDI